MDTARQVGVESSGGEDFVSKAGRQALSIRQRVADRPWAVLVGAAGVGMLLGLLGRRRRPRYHDREVFVGGAGL